MSDKLRGGVVASATSLMLVFTLRKTADSTEQTGKVAADMTGSYLRQGGVRVAIGLSDLAAVNSAFSSGGVKEIDATNMPGIYRLDVPDAAIAGAADWVKLAIKVAGCFLWELTLPISGIQAVNASQLAGSAAAATAQAAAAAAIVTGAFVTGTLSTTQATSNLTQGDGFFFNRTLVITSGALIGQAARIVRYEASSGRLYYTALTAAPANGDTFVIV